MTTHPPPNTARMTIRADVTSKSVVRIDGALLEKVGGFATEKTAGTNVVKEADESVGTK